ncbi:MAG: diaminopimelate epimerase [Oligosphaeraceae bacterium]
MTAEKGRWRKYHGLGNDYLIPLDPQEAAPDAVDADAVRRLCHPHYGLGSDGILYGPYLPGSPFYQSLRQPQALCAFRILNPDGSEAEKSGNGVRIFARYLWDCGLVDTDAPFVLATLGGPVTCRILHPRRAIQAQMGRVSFDSQEIPVAGPRREVLRESLSLPGEPAPLLFCAATVGNPHCVVLLETPPTREVALRLGPLLESHPLFPRRANVQFLHREDDHAIQVEIYERGAGYTLASGTSATACAAVAVKLGLCHSPVQVKMPGGTLEISLDDAFGATLAGPVERVYEACLRPDLP